MFANVSMTPFGSPVDPDVYWRNATASSRRGTSGSDASLNLSSRSVRFHTRPGGQRCVRDSAMRIWSSAFSVRHSDDPQDCLTRSNFFRPRASLFGSGG